jgi:hypothetical protein
VTVKLCQLPRLPILALGFLVCASAAHGIGGSGNALRFDGVDDYVSVAHTSALNGIPLTVMAWFKTTQIGNEVGLVKKPATTGLVGWDISLSGGALHASYRMSRFNAAYVGDTTPVADGTWHHVALVASSLGLELYLDGARQALGDSDLGITSIATTGAMRLGGLEPFNGEMDEVSVWNRALSVSEIQAYKNRNLNGNEFGLVAYYQFNESGGTTLADRASASGFNHGTLVGGPVFVRSGLLPFSPSVDTLLAVLVNSNSAVWHGVANPEGTNTTVWFEWGTSFLYGNVTAPQAIGSGSTNVAFSQLITGLSNGVVYHFRAVASNQLGVVYGDDRLYPPAPLGPGPSLDGSTQGVAAWGDYDNDGRLDFVVAGRRGGVPTTDLWRNQPWGFEFIANMLPDISGDTRHCAASWADFNRDGWLDLFLAGSVDGVAAISALWENVKGTNFASTQIADFPGLVTSNAEWCDYDNDGRPDLLLAGSASTNPFVTSLWRNLGNTMTAVETAIPAFSYGAAEWGDYDRDGLIDLLVAGQPVGTRVFRNTPGGFIEQSFGLPPSYDGSVAWGDYDNDGQLDFLLTGIGAAPFAQLWRNTGAGFVEVPIPGLPGVSRGGTAWGDYDNDGWLDFVITGTTNGMPSGTVAEFWRNTGGGFTKIDVALAGVMGTVTCADYDNDGRLDALLAGADINNVGIVRIFRGESAVLNSPPSAPTGLAMTISNGIAVLTWTSATDAQTPTAALTYNVRAGTTPGGADLISPNAAANGFRRLPARGNAESQTFAFLSGLAHGQQVYWSVQAIDNGFAGGPFAAESQFVFGSAPSLSITRTGLTATISWTPAGPGWVLQENGSLAPAGWSNAPSGAANPVNVPAGAGAKFYRLLTP